MLGMLGKLAKLRPHSSHVLAHIFTFFDFRYIR